MKIRIITGYLLLILFQGCAKIGNPTGGLKDVQPPVFTGSVPENRATNFKDSRIDLFFDEYVQIKDQNKEVVMSPPMKEKPVIRTREKGIRVTFNEDFLPSTTYTLNFGRSISDLNESNPLPDFEFVFSTGNTIDSLSVTGTVLNAFTYHPEKDGGLLIMLYENLADSAPILEIPRYYGKANESGLFAVNNIHADTFRVVALKDANNNLMYDEGIEMFAFLDSMLIINPQNVSPVTFIKDTVKIITQAPKQSKGVKADTAKADTIIAAGKKLNALSVSLYAFMEDGKKVYITSRNREAPERFSLSFNRPLFDSLTISPLNFRPVSGWYISETSAKNDTVIYWITDSLVAKMDTLNFKVSYLTTDSLNQFYTRSDTIKLRNQVAPKAEKGRREPKSEKKQNTKELAINGNVSNRGTLNLNADVKFAIPTPLNKLDPNYIGLFRKEDTVLIKQKFTVFPDTSSIHKFVISSNWQEDTPYKLILIPGAVQDIFNLTNDSIELDFSTQTEDYYGKILLNFSSDEYPMIVQVLNDKEVVVASKIANYPGIITFNYLQPGKYSLKAIFDKNGNGIWDTGNYLRHIQPEKVYLSGKLENLRSNWDWEPTWNISN